MNRVVIAGAILVILALDWAALHDIIKGNEPNFLAEWTMLGASVLLLPMLALRWKRQGAKELGH